MIIDLHGLREEEAYGKVQMKLMDFDASSDSTLEIITGKGIVIKDMTIDILNQQGYEWHHPNGNTGAIIVKKNLHY